MSLTEEQITAKNFQEFYSKIRPYLNGSFPTPIVNKFSKGDLYSTDEKIIGQWIDGKPLYQKTLEAAVTLADEWAGNISVSDLSIDTLVDTIGSVITPYKINVQLNGRLNSGNLNIYVVGLGGLVTNTVTIRYTKTTDSPISIGDGNDYSTDEQVVGTWIDGKPVYQKTIVSNSYWDMSTNSWTSTGASMSNIDMVINAIGIRDKRTLPIGARMNNDVVEIISYRSTGDEIDKVTIQYTKTTD